MFLPGVGGEETGVQKKEEPVREEEGRRHRPAGGMQKHLDPRGPRAGVGGPAAPPRGSTRPTLAGRTATLMNSPRGWGSGPAGFLSHPTKDPS